MTEFGEDRIARPNDPLNNPATGMQAEAPLAPDVKLPEAAQQRWSPLVLGALVIALAIVGIILSHAEQLMGKPSTTGTGLVKASNSQKDPSTSQAAALNPPDERALYVEAVEKFIMPVVTEPSGPQPGTPEELWGRLGDLEFWSRRVADGRAMDLTPDQRKVLERFESALKVKQTAEFPKLRAAYRTHVRNALWANDVDVYGSGRLIEFVSVSFAARRNMMEALDTIRADLTRLRFSQARFRWVRDGDGAQFALDTPSDDEIAKPIAK